MSILERKKIPSINLSHFFIFLWNSVNFSFVFWPKPNRRSSTAESESRNMRSLKLVRGLCHDQTNGIFLALCKGTCQFIFTQRTVLNHPLAHSPCHFWSKNYTLCFFLKWRLTHSKRKKLTKKNEGKNGQIKWWQNHIRKFWN